MSYPQIPQAQFGGQATASPNQGVDGNELSENIQALDLNQQQQQAATSTKKKSRRPARAFHTEFNSPSPGPGPIPIRPISPMANPYMNQQSQYSMAQSSSDLNCWLGDLLQIFMSLFFGIRRYVGVIFLFN